MKNLNLHRGCVKSYSERSEESHWKSKKLSFTRYNFTLQSNGFSREVRFCWKIYRL